MLPSKENCDKAILLLFNEGMRPRTTVSNDDYRFIMDFLGAVRGRLPYEATIQKDRARRTKTRRR